MLRTRAHPSAKVAFTNCDHLTDDGMRELATLPHLQRVSVGSCVRVTGFWLTSMPAGAEARHDGSRASYAEGYRAETLIFGDEERRLYVNGELRHVWREDYAGVRSRIGIGLQQSEMTIRELSVEPIV